MAYTNSPLVTYRNITKNKTTNRNHAIDTITIHCIVGQWTAKQGCDFFANTDRQCSANYVVGKDGSIGLSVDEKDRSWCSGGTDKYGNPIRINGISGSDNDHRAITIEVASDTSHPYAVTDEAYNALIKLVADICKRNGIKKLLWKGNKSLVGKINEQNMTVHRWFANKSCPGDYLYNRHGDIAAKVNAILGASPDKPTTPDKPVVPGKPSETTSLKAGAKLSLKGVALFGSAYSKTPASRKTGAFYLWGNEVINGKVKITNRPSNVGVAGQVTGFIDLADAENAAEGFSPYLVRVTTSPLNIRKKPTTESAVVGAIKDKGVYTIVEEATGAGAKKWGRLKSGAGWISLDYTKRV